MPFIIPFIPLIAAGVGAASTAYGIYNQVNQPSQSSLLAQQQAQMQQQQQTQQLNASRAAIGQTMPNLQAQLGGAVSPEYYAQVASTLSGFGNMMGNVGMPLANQMFGLGGGGGLAPGSVADFGGTGMNPMAPFASALAGSGAQGGLMPPALQQLMQGGGAAGLPPGIFGGGFNGGSVS